MAKTPPPPAAEPPTFEAALDQLDELIREMESGDLGLAASISAYEQGVGLLRHLHEQLADVERRVQTLVRIDDDGTPVFADPSGGSPDEPPSDKATAKRTSRRSRAKPLADTRASRQRLPGMDESDDNS